MNELVTVAISEMDAETFKVVTYDLKEKKFKALKIEKNDFYFNKKPVWDMFALTKVSLQRGSGEFFVPTTVPFIERIYDRDEMRLLIQNETIKQTLVTHYYRSRDLYGIIKIDYLDELYEPTNQGRFQQRIDFTSGGFERSGVLIKDYKWITYWQSLNREQWSEKVDHWKEYLQGDDVEIYAVFFRLNNTRWICGFHSL